MSITWRIPDCSYCEEPISADSGDFVQHFGGEGDYYFHTGCYEEWQRSTAEDPQWPVYQA